MWVGSIRVVAFLKHLQVVAPRLAGVFLILSWGDVCATSNYFLALLDQY